ncbi:DUF1415 domain-containing protein [Gilvimarinus sp. SDUM040013]|uniref:DUF1415 domain-containing protein n=1 Tax=Gilvimarinus gilvus TaxID=3058038 RepID=A0ABU4S397_9GAMM|nr:DUF1415 domain-containing protein [Gilvimarinus sp. SDUM040013]MDO3384508.1 DUF1415 domain-containing protein [Gilvimarinus sp. SDUM040013]MDX6851572.1 DUF1415 domain-containing protein [Gilvimarinus sp. SDUM040013]
MNDEIVRPVRQWVESFVVGMDLCPFAKRELVANRVRFAVSDSTVQDQLLLDLRSELERLLTDASIETTLLIHPYVLSDFYDYNQFLGDVDNLLVGMQLEGVFQVASFHPDYQFGGTSVDDAENYTNRSPYPILHILREASLEKAIEHYGDVDKIPERNIEKMNTLGVSRLRELLGFCVTHKG